MLVLLLMLACIPYVWTSAAAVLTLKAPLFVVLEDHAVRFPDSKPLAKIKSAA
jgi:hypothetical protein